MSYYDFDEIARRELKTAAQLAPKVKGFYHRYTEQEDDYIRMHYKQSNESAQEIASKLNLTANQVKGRAHVMGLGKKTRHARYWTPEEDKQLKELIHRYSITTISNMISHSPNAIKVRATRLKIHLRSRNGWYTKKDCCEILGIDHKLLQPFLDSGALKATYHNGRKPSKNGLAMWHIEGKDLREFIIKNSHEFNGRNVNLIKIVDLVGRGKNAQPNN
ncbi:MAG: SANT/Myb domain-containing protein [Dehalococcoidia bacterium]|nr:SANT/Myb domain-containing protein [Dehalococcoidia bacterium]